MGLPNKRRAPVSGGSFDFHRGNRVERFSFTCVAVRKAPKRSKHLRKCFSVVKVPCSSYNVFMDTLAFGGFTYGRCLGKFNISVTRSVRLFGKRAIASRRIIDHLKLPIFIGPGSNNDDFKIAGIGRTSTVRPTVSGTFDRNQRIIVRDFVSKARIAYNYCGATSGRIIFPLARIMASGRFFSFSTGCGKRMRRVAPTHVSTRRARGMRHRASEVCSVLKTGNLVHISCVVPTSNRPGLLRIGAAPNVATADFVPRRMQTTNLRVGSIVASVVRGRFGWLAVGGYRLPVV